MNYYPQHLSESLMLIKDRSSQFAAFGAAGHDTGRDCPVPPGNTILGITTHTAEEHDAWCNCMYADPAINARCKEKAGINPATWKYIALPWTVSGKDARALPGSLGFTKLVEQGIAEGGKLLNTQPAAQPSSQPAQTMTTSGGGSVVVGSSWTRPTVTAADRLRPVQFVQENVPGRPGGRIIGIADDAANLAQQAGPPLLLILAGVGIVGFLATRKGRGAPAMAGYAKRRRRSRR